MQKHRPVNAGDMTPQTYSAYKHSATDPTTQTRAWLVVLSLMIVVVAAAAAAK